MALSFVDVDHSPEFTAIGKPLFGKRQIPQIARWLRGHMDDDNPHFSCSAIELSDGTGLDIQMGSNQPLKTLANNFGMIAIDPSRGRVQPRYIRPRSSPLWNFYTYSNLEYGLPAPDTALAVEGKLDDDVAHAVRQKFLNSKNRFDIMLWMAGQPEDRPLAGGAMYRELESYGYLQPGFNQILSTLVRVKMLEVLPRTPGSGEGGTPHIRTDSLLWPALESLRAAMPEDMLLPTNPVTRP